jgi:hypothetical protein
MTFRLWLSQQRRRHDPVGDLARDALQDGVRWRTPRELRHRLDARDACEGAYESLRRARDEFACACRAAGRVRHD